jgi:tetratricopeptide (TPR) repeat protein
MSAEDFARRKRKIVFAWVGAGLLIVLLGVWIFRSSSAPQEAQKALDHGEQMLKAMRYLDAIQSFDHALASQSNLPRAYLLRGRARTALSQTEAAIQDFTKAIQLQPGSAEAFVDRASAHLEANDYAAVVTDCGDALSRDPQLASAHTLRGIAFRELGDLPRSLEDFNRAVELAPGVSNYFQRAVTYQALGEHTRAIADLDEVIALFPSSPLGYLARAKSRAASGDPSGAYSDRKTGGVLEEHKN